MCILISVSLDPTSSSTATKPYWTKLFAACGCTNTRWPDCWYLDAFSHLYKLLCPSTRWLVGNTFVKIVAYPQNLSRYVTQTGSWKRKSHLSRPLCPIKFNHPTRTHHCTPRYLLKYYLFIFNKVLAIKIISFSIFEIKYLLNHYTQNIAIWHGDRHNNSLPIGNCFDSVAKMSDF